MKITTKVLVLSLAFFLVQLAGSYYYFTSTIGFAPLLLLFWFSCLSMFLAVNSYYRTKMNGADDKRRIRLALSFVISTGINGLLFLVIVTKLWKLDVLGA